MTKIPVVSYDIDYRGRSARMYSYVAVLCEKGGSKVKAVRMDGYQRKSEVMDELEMEKGWNIKGVYKLNEEDFN